MARPRKAASSSAISNVKESPEYNINDEGLWFVLKGNRTNPFERIPSEGIALNPKTGKKEKIRFVEGVPTIWKSSQPSEVVKTTIALENGRLYVEKGDEAKFEYLTTLDLFNKVYEIEDLDREARERNLASRLNRKALALLDEKLETESGIKELEISARFLNLWSAEMSLDMLESSLTTFIQGNDKSIKPSPQAFIDSFDNELVQTKALVLRAIEVGILDFSQPNAAKYHGENGVICNIGAGEDPVDALVSFALSSKGAGVIERLRIRVEEVA
jgi:hypothetical protein